MNILIVEPSKVFQVTLETIFKPYATNIFISDSGAEAINIFKVLSIDMVCLSFYLSDMDGVDLVMNIRKIEFGETVPILMITSMKSEDTAVKSLRDGVTEIFHKNDLDALQRYLKTYAEHARQQSGIEGNILLIDSDQKQADAICNFFADTRLRFIHFISAEEAAGIAQAAEFDLVITNMDPGGSMSGMTLIREIRDINETMYRVPILAISAMSNVSQKIALLRAGVNDIIQKPILLEELSVRLKNLLHSKKLFDTVELQRRELEKLATRDQLTGLYNRHYLFGIAERTMEESHRYQFPVAILVIDLDHFKRINDTFGHATGDIVLKAVADLLKRNFRGSDTPVRFGGEEFLVLLPHCNGDGAVRRAQSLLEQIRMLQPESIPIAASIGVSVTPPVVKTAFGDLFAVADAAVYAAKGKGRDCVVFRGLRSSV